MKDISTLPGSMADVQSVTNAIDLVVGAVYDMSFVCTDMAPGAVNPSALSWRGQDGSIASGLNEIRNRIVAGARAVKEL